MATLDFYKDDGSKVKLSLADDPANPGQYLPKSAGDLSLGTPGTGEPAHAGGSTGLIGWARDILANGASILAKIAAFGTSEAPSADVLSVQYPSAYVGKATLTGVNQALTVDTLGAAQIAFHFPQATVSMVIIEGVNSNAGTPSWIPMKFIRPSPVDAVSNLNYSGSGQNFGAGDIILVSCAGFDQIRCRVSTHTSAFEVLASRIFSPGLNHVFAELSNQTVIPVSVGTITIPSNCSVYYTDTDTPLAANATFTGSTRTMQPGNNKFTANFYTETSPSSESSCILQSSHDLGWGYAVAAPTVMASPVNTISVERTAPYYRIYIAQSATAAAYTRILSSQTP